MWHIINKIVRINFSIGPYTDSADFDIVPMQSCHLLLAQPWIVKNNVLHYTITNDFSFKYNCKHIILEPLTAAQI